MNYFKVHGSWKEIEVYIKSDLFFPLKGKIAFMYALNENIVYFASNSPSAIKLVNDKFGLSKEDSITYNEVKMIAENIQWGCFGRNDFFSF